MNVQNGGVGLIGVVRGVLGLGLRLVENKFNVVWLSLMRYMICCIPLLLFFYWLPVMNHVTHMIHHLF